MTIQIPNPGTGVPADKTGDSPWLAMKKVAENFSDQTHAASRLVGTANGQIPLSQDIGLLTGKFTADMSMYNTATQGDANNFANGSKYLVTAGNVANCPSGAGSQRFLIETQSMYDFNEGQLQIATVYNDLVGRYLRIKSGDAWLPWQSMSITPNTYNTTTAAGANVVVDTAGRLSRSTSSERYKEILAPLVLDDARYADAMALKPIVYRSTADADNPLHHFYSFSAEELGAYDPAFTLWRTTEIIIDADGNTTEQLLAERQAEGININALLAMSHAIAIKQDKLIKDLQEQIDTLKPQPEI